MRNRSRRRRRRRHRHRFRRRRRFLLLFRRDSEVLHGAGKHLREPEEVQRVHRDVGGEAERQGERRDVFPSSSLESFFAAAADGAPGKTRRRRTGEERQRLPHLREAGAPELEREFEPKNDPRHEEARHHGQAAQGVRSALFAPFAPGGGERPAEVDKGGRGLEEQKRGCEVREVSGEGAEAEEAAADGAWGGGVKRGSRRKKKKRKGGEAFSS